MQLTSKIKTLFFASSLLLQSTLGQAQKKQQTALPVKPKLIVGIVVDQMRYDYLYRYSDKFGNGGFKRLVNQGFLFRDMHYNYIPTYTGPGHAAIYTGTTPSYNGIIANDWYDRDLGHSVYVTEDTTEHGVGGAGTAGQMSPRHLLSTTVTDELRLASNRRSKVIGIALKDRGAILPAGHMPTSAFWFDNNSGGWMTSSYYMETFPDWVKEFNLRKLSDQYLSRKWETLLPLDTYQGGLPNGSAYRKPFKGEKENKFPHDLPMLKPTNGYELLRQTPFGNDYTLDFAIAAMQSEKMGKGEYTDFLAISFSSTDYVGHQFGIESVEIQDTYTRLDRNIERLLNFLDKTYGKDNVLVFLTADHGAVETPGQMAELKVPGGIFNNKGLKEKINMALCEQFGDGQWLSDYQNLQFWLNDDLIKTKKKNRDEVAEVVCRQLRKMPGIYRAMSTSSLQTNTNEQMNDQLGNGINPFRSGDVILQLLPGWFEGAVPHAGGTTHGAGYDYDTHVPLLWYGWKVAHGSSGQQVHITDIAVTLSDLLNISHPSAAIGQVLSDLILVR